MLNSRLLPRINRCYEDAGLAPARDLLREVWSSPLLNLVAVSPAIARVPEDWPDDAVAETDIIVVTDLALAPDSDPRGRWPEESRWLRERYRSGATLCSVCTGSILLADAGLLDGQFGRPVLRRGRGGAPGQALLVRRSQRGPDALRRRCATSASRGCGHCTLPSLNRRALQPGQSGGPSGGRIRPGRAHLQATFPCSDRLLAGHAHIPICPVRVWFRRARISGRALVANTRSAAYNL